MRNAYIGILEVLFKYLECGDEIKPSSLRIASLAGKIALAAGLDLVWCAALYFCLVAPQETHGQGVVRVASSE